MANKRTYNKIDFSLEDEETLINFVKQNEPLFNPKHELYRNRIHRDRLWLEISNDLGKTGNDCQKKWNNLRDIYVRNKGKKLGTGSAAPAIQRRQEQMAFLDECSTARKSTLSNISDENSNSNSNSNDSDVVCISDNCDDGLTGNEPNPKRRRSTENPFEKLVSVYTRNSDERMKFLQKTQSSSEPMTELGHYFASICKTVEKMTEFEQARVKYEISNLVGRIEMDRLRGSQIDHHRSQINFQPSTYYPQNQHEIQTVPHSYSNSFDRFSTCRVPTTTTSVSPLPDHTLLNINTTNSSQAMASGTFSDNYGLHSPIYKANQPLEDNDYFLENL